MSIAPLETRYKGYRMRSRLESRFAIFFDALGIQYEYEKEGYHLSGHWYLPDFYLPELEYWIEIKGQPPSQAEEQKASQLAQATHHRVYLFWSDVAQESCENGRDDGGYMYRPFFSNKKGWRDEHQLWYECPECGLVGIAYEGRSDRLPCKQCYYCAHIWHRVPIKHELLSRCPTHGKNLDLRGCPRIGPYLDEGYNTNTPKIQAARVVVN